MDETDTGSITGPEAVSAETARQWAEQQRIAARTHFDTPTWLGPSRTNAGQVPPQVEPEHDDLDEVEDEPVVLPPAAQASIPESAHWTEKARPRLFAGALLVSSLVGVIVFLVLTITTQSMGAIAGLAGCAIVAVIFRGALMGSGVTTVDLKGSILRIRKGGVLDVVNLAEPAHNAELIGSPDDPSWRLRLEAIDGRIVELGPQQVDAPEMHRIVLHYRSIAERERRDRERRFNR